MIRLDACTVVYPAAAPSDPPALSSLSLEVAGGQFITVVGSNGAGKSTLLKLVSGAALPARGRVVLDGRDVTAAAAHRRADLVAQVFQDPLAGTCGNLSIEENFAVAACRGRRRGFGWAVDRALRDRVREGLAPAGLGLEDRLTATVGELSGGQRQVIAMAMATFADASILLLDEHTAALDPHTASLVMEMTDRLVRERGLTTLMVTHSLEQALRYGDRTLLLHRGRVVLDIAGAERAGLAVGDLLGLFRNREGEDLAEDRLLLGGR